MTDRRSLLQMMALISAGGGLLAPGPSAAQTPPGRTPALTPEESGRLGHEGHERLMALPEPKLRGDEQFAILLYPGFTALDVVGPHYFLACIMGATVHLVTTQGDDLSPIVSDLGLAIQPTTRLADCPTPLDLVFVPGGTDGTLAAMSHEPTLEFVKAASATNAFVTSVCTGALVLGAAGLLNGKRATSHWAVREALAGFGATPVDERVVTDGRVITGAGVSAGLDLGLSIVEAICGRSYAQALMLQAEYAPRPPFSGGSPETTDPAIADPMRDMFAPFVSNVERLIAARP